MERSEILDILLFMWDNSKQKSHMLYSFVEEDNIKHTNQRPTWEERRMANVYLEHRHEEAEDHIAVL